MIGQDRIVASPLAMAGVAATVADGRWHAPRLVDGDRRRTGTGAEPTASVATLRELMRSVVTSGTGTALAAVPGEVAGKSGTAEYGGGDPPPTHAWFIAFRGDLAIAVLVENGRSGGSVAAPIAKRASSTRWGRERELSSARRAGVRVANRLIEGDDRRSASQRRSGYR